MLRWSDVMLLLQKTKPRWACSAGFCFGGLVLVALSVVIVFALVTQGADDHGLTVGDVEQGHIA